DRIKTPPLRLYALTELLIGISALVVPHQLLWGRSLLERMSISSSWAYYLVAGFWMAITLVPWCACMGATLPIGMLAIKNSFNQESPRSFSFLYLANVLGAVAGASVPLLLIEIWGFRGTLRVGAILNGLLFASAMALTLRWSASEGISSSAEISNLRAPGREPVGGRKAAGFIIYHW